MPDCTPGSLVDLAACFNGLSPRQHQAIATYLLCQIANAGGGGSQTPWTSDIDGGCFNLNNVCKFNGIGVYRALLTQSGTDAPVATVLENTLGGTVVWSYEGDTGTYQATLNGAFPSGRTFVVCGNAGVNQVGLDMGFSILPDVIGITTTGDDILNNTSIEILVYPATPQCPDCAS